MESRVINRIRRHLLSLAIFSMESRVINHIRRHLLSVGYIFGKANKFRRHPLLLAHGKSCNKSY